MHDTNSNLSETTTATAALTGDDIDQIIEGINEFIISGIPEIEEVWRPYVDKLTAQRAQIVAGPELIDLLHRIHERLTDGRDLPEWMSGWAEEIDAAIAQTEGRS